MNGLYKSQCIFEEGRLKSNTLADISFEDSGEVAAIGIRVAADSQAETLNRITWLEAVSASKILTGLSTSDSRVCFYLCTGNQGQAAQMLNAQEIFPRGQVVIRVNVLPLQ